MPSPLVEAEYPRSSCSLYIFTKISEISEYLVYLVLRYSMTMRISSVLMFVHIEGYCPVVIDKLLSEV